MKTYITHDMSIAAFLLMSGKSIVKASKGKPGQKYIFEFEDPASDCEKIALSFLVSDYAKYDSCLRMLRTMLRSQ